MTPAKVLTDRLFHQLQSAYRNSLSLKSQARASLRPAVDLYVLIYDNARRRKGEVYPSSESEDSVFSVRGGGCGWRNGGEGKTGHCCEKKASFGEE